MSYTITVRELKTRQDNGDTLFLLDVREPHEYSMAKIEGSVLIPLGTLPNSLDQLDKNRRRRALNAREILSIVKDMQTEVKKDEEEAPKTKDISLQSLYYHLQKPE